MRANQRGLTLISLLIVGIFLVLAFVGVAKVVPTLVEYWNVKKVLGVMASQGELRGATPPDVRKSFDRRAIIDDITAITGKDLEIRKNGDSLSVSFRYEKRVHLFHNVSLLFDFQGSTSGRGVD
jgi:hypothetical protein